MKSLSVSLSLSVSVSITLVLISLVLITLITVTVVTYCQSGFGLLYEDSIMYEAASRTNTNQSKFVPLA